MNLEGFSQSEIDGFFGASSAPITTSAPTPPAAKSDPKFSKYDKMKDMNLPEGKY
jgi:hypothetical protein